MKFFLEFILIIFLKIVFWFRYSITVKGTENLKPENLKKPEGTLFIPNHPASFIDPALVTISVWPKFRIRPMIVEYMYFLPIVHGVMKLIGALPVPDFETSSNSIKRKRGERVIKELIKGLHAGDNFLIYPAGRLKHTGMEAIGGASGVHQIISETPNANVVLVRIKGLWGSSFSRAQIGRSPPLFETIWHGVKVVFKNLIFFTPRRQVVVQYVPAPADFPYGASKIELNRWLERWYNQPDGLTEQEGESPGDSTMLVPYYFWSKERPKLYTPPKRDEIKVELTDVDADVQQKIYTKLAELTEFDVSKIHADMSLAIDLGLDSLDTAELSSFLNDQFDVGTVPVTELTSVGRVLGIASKQVKFEAKEEEDDIDTTRWKYTGDRHVVQVADGDTIPEVFLNNCKRMGNVAACADLRSGVVPYPRMKLGVIAFADYIRKQPGEYIGILLPASVGAYITVLACQLAGKTPLMINWTQGKRHLEQVLEISDVKVVLTSWAFLERLDNVDLDGVDDMLVMLESVRREFTIFDKLKAFARSKMSTKSILKAFNVDKVSKDDPAVLLFTSGTESLPKGVPLSHDNILSNQRSALDFIDFYRDDVFLGILPPFHSFGFSTTGILGLLSGIRTVYSPNPTDGKAMTKAFEKWGVTIMCGAPAFIKTLLNAASAEQLKSMRLCVTGAEKAPDDLFEKMSKIGKEQCVVEGYGLTECSPILSANQPGKPRMGVGFPLPGVEIKIIHPETNKPLGVNERGLIIARGPNIFKGYINVGIKPPFITFEGEDWFNTGDLGFFDEQGRLTLSGRQKRFIKVGGEMVSLLSIEEVLQQNATKKGWATAEEGPGLAILGKEEAGEKSKIVLVTTFQIDLDRVNETLREEGFSNLVKVSRVDVIDEIPLMGTGKIHYRQLEDSHLN